MNFDKAYDLLDDVRERLETTIPNSSVDLIPSDTDDFFITVTQRNKTTGNESKWSFCVNFGTNKVQMLEPTEDEESFRNGNEVFSIIKNFLNGGMSREKRFGNKIGSSNKTVVRQGPNLKTLDETPAEHIMKNLDAYKGYTRYDMEELVLNPSGYTLYDGDNRKVVYKKDGAEDITLLFRNGELKDAKITSSRKPIKSGMYDTLIGKSDNGEYSLYLSDCKYANHGKDPHQEYMLAHNGQVTDSVRTDDPYATSVKEHWQDIFHIKGVKSSRKSIKSDFNPYYEKHPDIPVGYLLGGPADTITDADKKAADEYGLFYEGYGTMDGTEKGHLFIGEYQKLKSYFEDYMGHSLADDYIYPYKDSFGEHILDRFEIEMTWVLPTEKDYQDIVNKLNEYVDKEYSREFGTGSIYHFNMYKGGGTNSDGYGHEYPNYVIFDTEGNLDLFSGDEIVQYIDNLLAEKGWYKEPVSDRDNFTIAIK